MPELSQVFATAMQHYQAGRLHEAEVLCRQVLAAAPDEPTAWYLLGLLAAQAGQPQAAMALIQRALVLKPDLAEAHGNLATIYFQQGLLGEAISHYQRALESGPPQAEILNNLGNAFSRLGDKGNAIACYRRALELRPDSAELHNNLANACFEQGMLNESVSFFKRSLELKPDFAEAHNNLGVLFRELGEFDEAVNCGYRALALKPNYVEAYNNIAAAHWKAGRLEVGADYARRALELHPGYADAHTNLGNILRDQGAFGDAESLYRRAIELNPGSFDSHNSLGALLLAQGLYEEAAASFHRSLELKSDFVGARWNRSLLMLLHGDFECGWPEYEWRWRTSGTRAREFPQPQWDGSAPAGRVVLLHAEQGFGDTFQFVRYAKLIKNLGAKVVVECQMPLVNVLRGCDGIDYVCARGDALPAFDCHVAMMSLPLIFRTSLQNIPTDNPYIHADATAVARWRERLQPIQGFRIGINWHGRGGHGNFRRRDIPIERMLSLGAVSNVHLVCLQKEMDSKESSAIAAAKVFSPGADFDSSHGAFVDTAAILANLDLVITSDTAVAHLAGALGVAVWCALPYSPDWRWLLHRSDSPWYPTMRLFRQKQPGDWAEVFEEMQAALVDRVSAKKVT